MPFRRISHTPSTVVGAVSTNDVIVETEEIKNFTSRPGGVVRLHSLRVLDNDDQGTAIDIVLLRSNVSLGTENGAVAITDANAAEIEAVVSIAAADFVDHIGNRVAEAKNISTILEAAQATRSLFVAAVCRSGTPTYSAAGLQFFFGIEIDD